VQNRPCTIELGSGKVEPGEHSILGVAKQAPKQRAQGQRRGEQATRRAAAQAEHRGGSRFKQKQRQQKGWRFLARESQLGDILSIAKHLREGNRHRAKQTKCQNRLNYAQPASRFSSIGPGNCPNIAEACRAGTLKRRWYHLTASKTVVDLWLKIKFPESTFSTNRDVQIARINGPQVRISILKTWKF
jgi:hypothetical protein